jgi:UDP-N-acetylmuramate--alanine ligase
MKGITKEDKIHFIGIGGYGMSGIAQILYELGYKVSGSDIKNGEITERLSSMGIPIYIGHSPRYIEGSTVVVVSSAVHSDNPELVEARKRGLTIFQRGEMLAYLMSEKRSIAIAGSHGKTTMTSMIGIILDMGGFSPTIVVGGEVTDIGGTAKLGNGELFVAETDESDGSFLKLFPNIEIVSNVDNDHLDYYKNIENIRKAFVQFFRQAKDTIFVCSDDPFLAEMKTDKTKITYGLDRRSLYSAQDIELNEAGSSFETIKEGKSLGRIKLSIPGLHNVKNALGAIAVSDMLGVPWDTITMGLQNFKGVSRRLQICDYIGNTPVIEDYAHHPTEIKASLEALKVLANQRKIVLVFQPHRYTRTYYLYKEIASAIALADYVLVLDIYPASESPIEGINSGIIIENLPSQNRNGVWIRDIDSLIGELKRIGLEDRVLVFMGAGNIDCISKEILSSLKG